MRSAKVWWNAIPHQIIPFALGQSARVVVTVRRIEEVYGLCRCVLIECDDGSVFFVKLVDELADVRLMKRVPWMPTATRAQLIEQGMRDLFCAPADEQNFVPADLEMAVSLQLTVGDRDIRYNRKTPTQYGESERTPAESGIGVEFVHWTEYLAVENTESPELLCIELGGIDAEGEKLPHGGVMALYEGRNVTEAETKGPRRW